MYSTVHVPATTAYAKFHNNASSAVHMPAKWNESPRYFPAPYNYARRAVPVAK